MPAPQNYRNHGRIIPLYHGGIFLVFMANVIWTTRELYRAPSAGTAVALAMAMAFVGLFFYARAFALTAQDRVIRLEMRLRMREVLPPELQGRIQDFTIDQLIALRFASDAELPALAATVLRDNITDRKAVKLMVKDWQADYLRV